MLKENIKKIIWRMRGVRYENGVILNYKKYLLGKAKAKTALLSYLTKPFLSFSREIPHNNWGLVRNIVKALNQSGFTVDIIDWQDKNFTPTKKYDLFIGHGGKNFEKITKNLDNSCLKIYYSTGLYWKFHNDQEAKRLKEASEKKSYEFKPDRMIAEPEEGALKKADAIIALGGEFSKKTYAAFPEVYTLDNFFQPDKKFKLSKKDFATAKNNFLFLSGSGNIHKGLDLALEAFAQMPDKNLYICTKLDEDFAKVYQKELFETKNIHFTGFLKEKSDELREMAYKCGFLIHPSCSEGSPGVVMTAMFYGLMPIISQESNTDIGGFGYQLSENTAACLKETILKASERKYDFETAERMNKFAEENFSEKKFLESFKKCLQRAIDNHSPKK